MPDFEYEAADENDVIKYWQYILGKPIDKNPSADNDGSKHEYTTNPIYLSSNANKGSANRPLRDSISADKPVLVAVNPCVVVQPHVPGGTVQECKKCAEDDENSAKEATLTVDSTTIDVREPKYRVQTRPFDVDVPKNGIHNTPPGRWKAVADGYYIKLKQLTRGPHRINFKGEVEYPYDEKPPWDQDITYQLKVN